MAVTITWAVFPEGSTPDGAFFYSNYRWWAAFEREMFEQGLVYEADHLYEELPTWDEFNVPDDPEGTEEFRAWEQAVEPMLWKEDPEPFGLPWHKVDSCEGHVLTPREIEAALAKASVSPRTFDKEDLVDTWREWLAFLRRAATEGGGARVSMGVEMGAGYRPKVPEEWKKERGEVLLHQAVRIFYSDKAVAKRREELLVFAKMHADDQAVQDQVAGYMEVLAIEEDAAKGS